MSAGGAPPVLDIAIIGAGIAGLSAAHSLLERGHARGVPIRLAIFDAGTRAGGVIHTERIDGFLVEAGPDCFITDKPWALRLCERLGLADDLGGESRIGGHGCSRVVLNTFRWLYQRWDDQQ